MYNLLAIYVDQQNKILANMTKAEIDALAKKWINTSKMNILLVGDKAKTIEGVKKLGYEVVEFNKKSVPIITGTLFFILYSYYYLYF